jgi:hypothetical protein
MLRIKRHECLPMFRWFLTWVQEFKNGEEYRMVAIKLPSWNWQLDLNMDDYCWHQMVLLYHGRDGLQIHWFPDYSRESEQQAQ